MRLRGREISPWFEIYLKYPHFLICEEKLEIKIID
jgi:hypothetical protein